jgi:acetoacetate decarboxylase
MKRIPSVTGPSLFDVKQLVTAVLRDEIQQEVRPGDATLRLGSTAADPLERIPVLEIVQGVYFTGGFVLDYGQIVHDYLANG